MTSVIPILLVNHIHFIDKPQLFHRPPSPIGQNEKAAASGDPGAASPAPRRSAAGDEWPLPTRRASRSVVKFYGS